MVLFDKHDVGLKQNYDLIVSRLAFYSKSGGKSCLGDVICVEKQWLNC